MQNEKCQMKCLSRYSLILHSPFCILHLSRFQGLESNQRTPVSETGDATNSINPGITEALAPGVRIERTTSGFKARRHYHLRLPRNKN